MRQSFLRVGITNDKFQYEGKNAASVRDKKHNI